MSQLRTLEASELPDLRRDAVDDETLEQARRIVEDVRREGESALVKHATRLGDLQEGQALVLDREALRQVAEAIPSEQRDLLERTCARIRRFAEAQRSALGEVRVELPGGYASHDIAPVTRAACYAPGGRFPLPSSVLMTAATARAAGVERIWVASPKPAPITIAAAAIAGADMFLTAGGAQAIAALAYGAGPVEACDVIVGPGNRWVTAAKQLVFGRVRIDMLAGPSELVVVADDSADPELIASDLLAQAEHDVDALPILIATDALVVERVNRALESQLASLPTRATAEIAITRGFAIIASSPEDAVRLSDQIAPEHLEVLTADAEALAPRFKHYGGLFVGTGSAEVLGDYGAGPNHVLPTGGTARSNGGLSVLTFLRVRTQLHLNDPKAAEAIIEDAILLARAEGLEGHARSAEHRLETKKP